MGLLRHSLKDLVKVQLNDEALDKLQWKDFGNGLSMARLARAGARELVLYRIRADADPSAFLKHEHIGGEFYLVLKGKIADESGAYSEGISYTWIRSRRTPLGPREKPWYWSSGPRACASWKRTSRVS